MRIRIFLTMDPGWKKFGSGIRDKHPGSATLFFFSFQKSIIVMTKRNLKKVFKIKSKGTIVVLEADYLICNWLC
jgi:hypothetical protein